ncbi:unnamed protein product [Closterium sp. NIES-54]
MYITLYFIITHLFDSLRNARDHFLTLDPIVVPLVALLACLSLRGVPPPPLPPPTPLLLLLTSLVLRTPGLLLLVGSAAAARARVARVVEVAAGVVVGAAVEVVEVVEVVAAVGVVAGVGALVVGVVVAVGVEVVAAVGVVAVRVELFRGEVLAVASGSSISIGARPLRPSSFVSGFLSVGRLGRPCWAKLLRSGAAIFDLDYDAILAAMYAFSVSAGVTVTCMPCTPLRLTQVLPAVSFRDSTTLTPLSAPKLVRLVDPSGGPVLARSSTVLPCPAYRCPPGCDGHHHHSWGSACVDLHVYMDGPSPAQVSASGPVAPPCSCRLLSHQNLLWHHCLGHPSLPRLRGMHSHLLVSGLSKSLPPLPPLPATPCLPFVEGRQRGAPHSSSFPATTTSLQTLHMDDLPVLRLHSDRGGEFSSNLLRDFYHGEGVLQSFALPASPQQNGIAEHRIGLVMEVARTSMIHAAAPNFCGRLRSGTLRISSTSGPVSPCRRPRPHCVGRGRLGMRQCSGSGVLVPLFAIRPRTSSPPALFPASSLAFPLTCLAGSFTTPPRAVSSPLRTSCRQVSSLLPSLALPLCPSPPPAALPHSRSPSVDPLPPQGPAPSGVSQVDPLLGAVPVEVAVDSGAARGAAYGGAAFGGAASGGAEPARAEPGGAEPEGAGSGGAEPGGARSGVWGC